MPESPAESIFFAALGKPTPDGRAAFLDAACGADLDLRRRVEKLLAAHPHAVGFLEQPAADFAPTQDFPADKPPAHAPDPPTADHQTVDVGARVGPYKLLQKLGEGGMGEVWVAEQDKPVRRRVALKLIKPGMDSDRVVARFEAERQALALMDHTNIAKVFDAGTTPTGRPFFAMELVKGVPITTYCDELHLSIRERLQLFVPVCQAVQHAHQKGVIHRDIKPTNVLVAIQDGKPVPKVIDFGVAKALTAKLAERTMYTELGAVIGTLEYMAPEQAELSALDVDTRADVYALGALLYELLTGSTPLDRGRLKTAGFVEVLRLIREEEPPKPSTRLTQSREALAGLAAKRRTEPRKLGAEVRGELDWIVMRCLEKDRTRRYESAGGLARDVERFLGDEAVEACPPSAGYRVRKLLRRNRAAVVAAAAILVATVLAVAGQTWNLFRAWDAERQARESEQEAIHERSRAQHARETADTARREAMIERDRAVKAKAEEGFARTLADDARQKAEDAKAQALRERDAHQAALVRSDGLRLGSEAMLARPANPGQALLLGLEAVRRYPHPLTFNALFDAAADLRERRTIVTDKYDLHFVRPSPDGRRLLVGTGSSAGSGGAVILDAATGKTLVEWTAFGNGHTDFDWSPDGARVVAAVSGQVTVAFTDGKKPDRATFTGRVAHVWDAATGQDVLHLRGHADTIASARFSPDGTKIVTASWDETARVWDAATGKELHVLRGHTRALESARFSPDGKRVLTLSSQSWKSANHREVPSGKLRPEPADADPGLTTRPWRSSGSSSGGTYHWAAAEKPVARLWDADTGREVGRLTIEKGLFGLLDSTEDHAQVAAYSPDGARIVVGFQNDLIGVWGAAGGNAVRLLRGHRASVSAVAFSPDGRRLAAAGHKNLVFLFDLETGRELRRLEGHDHTQVYSVRFSKDGTRLVSAAADSSARVWDVYSGRQLAVFRGHLGSIREAHFLGDADTVVTAADKTVRFWSVKPPPPVPTLLTQQGSDTVFLGSFFGMTRPAGHTAGLKALSFSPDGTSVLTGAQDYSVRLWDAATGRHVAAVADGLRGSVTYARFAPDGKTVLIGTDLNRSSRADGGDKDTLLSMAHRWDPATGKAVRFLKQQASGIARMAVSPDGRRAAVVRGWGTLGFKPTKSDPLAYEWVSGEEGSRAGVWDAETGERLFRLPADRNTTDVAPPQFSPDGKAVLYARSNPDDLALYDAGTGAVLRTLVAPQDDYGSWSVAAFSPDGRTVVGRRQSGRFVWFWAAGTGALLGRCQLPVGNTGWGEAVAFSPDSKRLAVVADRYVYWIDVATRTWDPNLTLRGHDAKVTALAFSPDGSRLLTGSDDQSAILWDAATGRIRSVYKGHSGPVRLVAYSPDGTRVATASDDPLARVWPVDLLPAFEARKPRELTTQERDRYELPAK